MPDWRWFRQMSLRLRTLFQRNRVERELEEEFQFHIEQRTELEIARGLSPAEARSVALRVMDGLEQRKQECRDMRHVNYVDDFLRDLQYAGRNLRRSPGFATLAVLIMALGIGANTAVFSVVNAVLLKPLSYRDPDRIVALSNILTTGEAPTALSKQISIPDFQDWHDQSSSFSAMAYYQSGEAAVVAGSTAEYAQVTRVSPEFFRALAIEPIAGRLFTAEEMKPGGGGAVMISYAYWERRFASDPAVVGRTVKLCDTPFTIVGVTPRDFFGIEVGKAPDFFAPSMMQPTLMPASENFLAKPILIAGWLTPIARLRAGATASRVNTNRHHQGTGRRGCLTNAAHGRVFQVIEDDVTKRCPAERQQLLMRRAAKFQQ